VCRQSADSCFVGGGADWRVLISIEGMLPPVYPTPKPRQATQ
jgi:hypothetical protein